jgi:hypothetical protein
VLLVKIILIVLIEAEIQDLPIIRVKCTFNVKSATMENFLETIDVHVHVGEVSIQRRETL